MNLRHPAHMSMIAQFKANFMNAARAADNAHFSSNSLVAIAMAFGMTESNTTTYSVLSATGDPSRISLRGLVASSLVNCQQSRAKPGPP